MSMVVDALSWFLLVSGGLLCVVSSIGLLRLPEFYSRTHASGIGDSLGAGLVLTGLALQAGIGLVTVKLAFTLGFLLLTSPIATHALVKAAYAKGIRVPTPGSGADAVSD